jgi:hypothetical protein
VPVLLFSAPPVRAGDSLFGMKESTVDWQPPRSLLLSVSAGERVPPNDGPAVIAAADLVERCIDDVGLVSSETVLAVEITLRYGEKRRPARARHDAMARKHRLASYTVQEPLDEMMAEDVPTLTARFARALLECLALGAEEGTLDPVKVGAVRSSAEDRC